MKIISKLILLTLLTILLLPAQPILSQPPAPPHIFDGNVTIDGLTAPDGTSVTAEMNNSTVASTSTSGGYYLLEVEGTWGDTGATITFYVNGLEADTASFDPGHYTPQNLSVETPPPPPPEENERVLTIKVNGQGTTTPSPGAHNYDRGKTVNIAAIPAQGWIFVGWTGSTVADPSSAETIVRMTVNKTITANFELTSDETPPIISNVTTINITKDSADITWNTNEPATSRVEYSGELTPLGVSLVANHSVHLSDLSPATTYTFRVMSQDSSDNFSASDYYSFTTLGQPATFELSDWDITLTPSTDGYNVEFSFLLSNTGDLPGSYDAILKIDSTEADTKNISLEGKTDQTVICTASTTSPGTHTAEIGGVNLVFTISSTSISDGDGEEQAPAEVNWGLIGGIAGGVILIIAIILLIVSRTHYIVLFIRK